jgi:regulatory protein
MMDDDTSRRPSRVRKVIKPKPVTTSYLSSVGMAYLAQRSASRSMLLQVFKRRALRRQQVKTLEPDVLALVNATLDQLTALGLLDDARFAVGRAATLQRKGLPARRIAAGLKQKGLDGETISTAMANPIDEVAQARRFAERRRLGPWRSGLSRQDDATRDEKDLRALMRAGFNFRTAKAALTTDDEAR